MGQSPSVGEIEHGIPGNRMPIWGSIPVPFHAIDRSLAAGTMLCLSRCSTGKTAIAAGGM